MKHTRLLILVLSILLGLIALIILWTPKLQVNLILIGLLVLASTLCSAIILFSRRSSRPTWFYLPAVTLWLAFLWFLPQIMCPGTLRDLASYLSARHAIHPAWRGTAPVPGGKPRPCSGWSVQLNKTVSCSAAGISQDDFPCLGCCFEYACDCDCPSNNPPSVSGSVSCGVLSSTGWCVSGATLNMSASDPEGGAVTISGTILGSPFTCPTGTSCSMDLPEGNGSAVFHATDSGGLSSGDFSVNFQYDSTAPSVSPVISGTSGSGGWYTSSVTVSSSGSDAVSGILQAQSLIWTVAAGRTSASLGDGTYSVIFAALDGAGNEVLDHSHDYKWTRPRLHSDSISAERALARMAGTPAQFRQDLPLTMRSAAYQLFACGWMVEPGWIGPVRPFRSAQGRICWRLKRRTSRGIRQAHRWK